MSPRTIVLDYPTECESHEREILDRIAIDAALDKLTPQDRDMIVLLYAYDCPSDYTGPWPATVDAIAVYLGGKYDGFARSATAVRRQHAEVLARWRWAMQSVIGSTQLVATSSTDSSRSHQAPEDRRMAA